MIQKLALWFCCCWLVCAWSQEGKTLHKVFTKQDGITLDYIETLAYDQDGYIWLGGSSLDMREIIGNNQEPSIQRFNGMTFHDFPLPILSQPITSVRQLYQRSDGLLYVIGAMNKGHEFVLLFNPVTTQYQELSLLPESTQAYNLSKIFHYQGEDYIIAQTGQTIHLFKLSIEGSPQTLFSYTITDSLFVVDQMTVIIPFSDVVLIGDNHFPVHYFRWDGKLLKKEEDIRKVSNTDGESVRRYIDEFAQQQDTTYVMLYRNPQLHYIDTKELAIKPVPNKEAQIPSDHLKGIEDSQGNVLWISSKEGHLSIQEYLPSKGLYTRFKRELFNTSEPFTVLSNDVTKELWVGRNQGELHYFKFPSQTVQNFLVNNSIRAMEAIDEDQYIVATETKGWFQLNLKEGEVTPFSIMSVDTVLNPNSSRAIFKEGNTLWSNDGSNMLAVDINTHEAQRYRHYPIISLVKASDSTFIYGTNGYALMEFNKRTQKHRKLLDTKKYRIFGLAYNMGLCLLATNKGIITYNVATQEHHFFGTEVLEDPYLLMATYHSDYGFLIGSRNGIIYQYHLETNTFEVRYKDALEAGIATILFEGSHWWIHTFNGVVAYNTQTKQVTRYSEKDGFSHNEANRYSALATEDGFLMGTIEGLNFYKPTALSNANPPWELQLLKLQQYQPDTKSLVSLTDRSILRKLSTIVLPQENKTLTLDFALSNNAAGKEHTFQYRFNEGDWVAINEQQQVSFPNLAAGTYMLQIAALDFSGKSIGQPLEYTIVAKDFFYNEWWFYLLISLLGLLVVVYLLKQATQKRKMQEAFSGALLVSQEKERTRIAKELHDSIGQQLTLIKRKAQQDQQEEIASLSHKTLEEVRGISRGLYPAVLKQLGLSESIEQLVYEIDEDTSLFCTAEIHNIDAYFNEEKSLNFYRFIQESINNSLKHSKATNLSVTINDHKDVIRLVIKDNGKGFDVLEAIKNNSLGLKTLRERMRLLNGTMHIESSTNKGTKIQCEIPKNE